MYQNDFILREIEGLTRVLGKILFHREAEREEVIDEQNLVSGAGFFRHTLFRMLSEGRINDAEDLLHEQIEDDPRTEYLRIALDFYEQLSKMKDEELEARRFSREEIAQGLEDIKQYYVDGEAESP